MNPKIAIHVRAGSFSDRWVEYCRQCHIEVKLVNCHDSDILHQLKDVEALLWHWTHIRPSDMLIARHIIHAAELMGLKVYPNTATCWHFDDKIAQKYLLEAHSAPLVPTHVFYSRKDALRWVGRTSFPKVFKLRRGASSSNVRLVADARQARALIDRAFGRGFNPSGPYLGDMSVKWRRLRKGRGVIQVLRAIPERLRGLWKINSGMGREKGYVCFQDYLPDNKFDTRVTIIGQRAFAFRRAVRKNDFRASGSGMIDYDPAGIDPACIVTAFNVAAAIGAQSAAFDLIYDWHGAPAIVELSYGFMSEPIRRCPGHWDRSLNWHEGQCRPEDAILRDLLNGQSADGILPLAAKPEEQPEGLMARVAG